MKIVVIGSALSGNKGAAAMLESSVQTLTQKYKNTTFTLLSLYPQEDARQNTFKNLSIVSAKPLYLGVVVVPLSFFYRIFPPLRPWLRKNKVIREIASSNVFLDQGGITFSDGREPFLLYNVASILPAMFMKVPVLKCAQALGPFNNPINKLVSRIILPKVTLIVSRGEYTHQNLVNFGLTNIVEGADYAFSLQTSREAGQSLSKKVRLEELKKSKKIVGISPSMVLKKQCAKIGVDYQQIITEFINELTAKEYLVVLVAHSAREDSAKKHNNDLPLCREVYQGINEKESVLFPDMELSSEELRSLIGRCDMFIASRFHAMVSSLASGVPVLVIGWSHKYAEVLKMFEVEKNAIPFKDLSKKRLQSEFKKLEKEKQELKKKIDKNLPKVQAVSRRHVEFVARIAQGL